MPNDYKQMERIHDGQPVIGNDTQAIAESIVPFYTDDTKKAKYLSYRTAFFSVAESCKLADVHLKTIRRWRESDPNFRKIDVEDMGELRKSMSSQFLDAEFTRNFRLIMQKDFTIIDKSMDARRVLTEFEQAYLLKLRSHYTPQQLAMIKQLLGGGTVDKPFDFTKLTLTIKRERETMEITGENIPTQ